MEILNEPHESVGRTEYVVGLEQKLAGMEAEIDRLNEALVRLHLHNEELTRAFLGASDVARHNYEEAELRANIACGWAFDFGRLGVACYWCHTTLGNDPDIIRQHTASCEKRSNPEISG